MADMPIVTGGKRGLGPDAYGGHPCTDCLKIKH